MTIEGSFLKTLKNNRIAIQIIYSHAETEDLDQEIPFFITLFGNANMLDYQAEPIELAIGTGDSVSLGIKLSDDNQPVSGVKNVVARITKPKNAYGNLIKQYISSDLNNDQLIYTDEKKEPLTLAIDNLSQIDSASEELNEKIVETVQLKPLKGTYWDKHPDSSDFGSIFEATRIPGQYIVEYIVQGVTEKQGKFNRKITRTFSVYAKPDSKFTQINVDQDLKAWKLCVVIIPKDQFGNFAGPGFLDQIQFQIENGSIEKKVDNLDGSFTMFMDLSKVGNIRWARTRLEIAGEKNLQRLLW